MHKVVVVGGTGFLGYHAIKLMLARGGYEITALALPHKGTEDILPPEVKLEYANLEQLSDEQIMALLKGHDSAIFAAGADDRITPQKPALPFFRRHNVEAASRFFKLARQAGVKRGVLLSSYFAYFDRTWPEMKLAQHHPYIKSRVEQEAACLEACGSELELIILELPYIFGAMKGRAPLWVPLIGYFQKMKTIYYPGGGSNMVSVDHIAESIVNSLDHGTPGSRYVIGDENLTWEQFIHRVTKLMGREKKVRTLPKWLVKISLFFVLLKHKLEGKEGGLSPLALADLQTRNCFFDSKIAQEALHFQGGGLDEAFQATIAACQKQ